MNMKKISLDFLDFRIFTEMLSLYVVRCTLYVVYVPYEECVPGYCHFYIFSSIFYD